MYVIKKGSLYVALPGRRSSYTYKVEFARRFDTPEAAQAEACGDEKVVQLHMVWGEQ